MTKTDTNTAWPRETDQEKINPPHAVPSVDKKDAFADTQLDDPLERWKISDRANFKDTFSIDDLPPEIIYYLAKIVDIELVNEVYVEEISHDVVRIWTILENRDFDVMDTIYDIEHDVLTTFPTVDIRFRVTVDSENNPDIKTVGVKILDNE